MRLTRLPLFAVCVFALNIVCVSIVFVAASADAEELAHSVVLDGLNNPTGVAVQPDTGTVFVVESGARQIVRLNEAGDKAEPVVVGFPEDTYGENPKYKIGPLSIAFLDKTTLAVGGGGKPDGEELIYIVAIPDAGADPVNIDTAASYDPLAAVEANGDEPAVPGEGNFFNVVAIEGHVFATANGDDEKGWIARGAVTNNKPSGPLERFIATKPGVKVNAPVALTKTPKNNLLVGQMGPIKNEKDSWLTFYDRKSGKSLMSLPTDLYDIIALQYGPIKQPYAKSHLYALDYSWADSSKGRLVRIDAKLDDGGKQTIATVTLASLVHPTSMAFAPDNSLYVTLLSADESSENADGKLIKFEPGL